MFFASVVAFALSPVLADHVARNTVEVRFAVTDEAGKPVPGASVYANMSSRTAVQNQSETTGTDGVATVRRPAALHRMRVWVSADGYAGLFRGWEPEDEAVPPAEFRVALPKATTIGGRILDADGKGVPGARIEARCTVPRGVLPDSVEFNSLLAYSTSAAVTDAAGRWKLTNAPAPATAFSLRVEHPDYVSDTRYGELQAAAAVTDAQLRAGEAVIRLGRGARVTGTVTDAFGKPVAGALVVFHDDPYMTPGSQEVTTDADGVYALPTLRPGRHPVTVVARGQRPERRELVLAAGARTEDFRLYAGVPLIVKVVDEAGAPVPRVTFAIDSWRKSKSLYNNVHPDVTPSGVPNVSKPGGVYEWSWAPEDAVTFHVLAAGFQRQTVALTAGGEQTLVLRKTPAVSGKVTDAKTGLPVAGFRVVPVIDFGRDLYAVERWGAIDGTSGAYRFEMKRSDCDYRLLVEAPGYRTALSRAGLLKDRVAVADFALDPAGKPVKGAKVSLATSVQTLTFPRDNNLSAETDAAGRFSLPAQAERFALFAEHPAGSARVERGPDEAAGDLTVRPWASVSGTLWQAGKAVAGQSVFLAPIDRVELGAGPRVQIDLQMRSGEGGAFRFDRVPAGAYTLHPHLGPWSDSPLSSAERVLFDLKPGDAVRYDLGKGGATVRGRFALAGEPPPGLTFEFSLNTLVRRTPDAALPKAAAPPGIDLTRAWDHKRMRDDPAARASLAAHRSFFVKPTPAGEFRIGGVPAGDYWLVAAVYEKPDGCLVSPVGVAAVPVTVTAAQAAGGECVAVAAVEVPVRLGPQVGDRLPALALLDPAGRPLDLAALKGRTTLLHGWAGWCAACPRDFAALRKLRADVPADALAVVGLNFDEDAATAGRLAAKYDFPWPQACAGTPAGAPAADQLGVGSVPLYVVLDPDGVVAYRGSDWAAAEKAVRAGPAK